MTPEAQKRIAARPRTGSSFSNGVYDSYENLSLYDRCITRGYPGSMLPAIYGDSYQIVQGPGWVGIRYRDDPRDARHPARQPAARQQGDRARHGRSRAATGKATRSSSRRRISGTAASTATPIRKRCGWSRTIHADVADHDRMVGHGGRSDDLDAAVDVLDAADDERRRAGATSTRATKATTR